MTITKIIDLSALVLFCGLIFWLSNQEQLPITNTFENQDKAHHFIAYFVMGVLAWRAFNHFNLSLQGRIWVTIGFCSLYGISDELHQLFVPGRETSTWDWLADNAGAITAIVGLQLYYRKAR